MFSREAILAAYHDRHACKKFDPTRRVSVEDVNFILETGRLSPSSFGFEPWKFLVIQDKAILELIRDMAWGAKDKIMDCSHYVLILARTAQSLAPHGPYLHSLMRDIHHIEDAAATARAARFENFCRDDFEILNSDRAMYDWACKQTYIALGNMMTTAGMIGVDSLAVEGFPLESLNSALVQRGLWNGAEFKLSVMMALGYRVDAPRPKTRRAFADVVQWIGENHCAQHGNAGAGQ